MRWFLKTDILAGLLLIVISTLAAFEIRDLPLGTFRQMGPGMFPAIITGILGVFGLGQVVIGCLGHSRLVHFSLRKVAAVLGSIALFALTITRFGFVPAVSITLLTVSFGDTTMGARKLLLLCIVLPALIYGLFFLGLGLQIKPFTWRL